MDFVKKRWISLGSGIFLELFTGIGYAFSVFVLPLSERYGWSISQIALAYTAYSVTTMIATIAIMPKVSARMSIANCVLVGAILYGGGIALSGLAHHLLLFFLFFSIMAGIGLSMIHPVMMSYSVQLFPDKGGGASGFMASGLAFGSLVWAVTASAIYEATKNISLVLNLFGLVFFVAIAILSRLIYTTPVGFRESFTKNADHAKLSVSYSEKNSKEMLRDGLFYLIYLTIICNCICGAMVISQASPIMQFSFHTTAQKAAGVVGIFALANALGRPVVGNVSDKLGRLRTTVLIDFLMGVSMVILYTAHTQAAYIAAMVLCALCYGGMASLVAPLTSDLFGHEHMTQNYGYMFTVYGISSTVGAPLIALLKENFGGYDMAFAAGIGFCLVGVIAAVCIYRKTEGKKAVSSKLSVE